MNRKATLGAWLVSSLLLTLMPCFGQQTNLKSATTPKAATANYGKLPLLFERNQGQTDPRVKFISNGAGYTVFLTAGEMVLSLRPSEVVNPNAFTPGAASKRRALCLQVRGAKSVQ